MLRALGAAPDGIPTNVDEAAALLRTMLAAQKVLLVLDDAVDSAQVMPLLPGAVLQHDPQVHVLAQVIVVAGVLA